MIFWSKMEVDESRRVLSNCFQFVNGVKRLIRQRILVGLLALEQTVGSV